MPTSSPSRVSGVLPGLCPVSGPWGGRRVHPGEARFRGAGHTVRWGQCMGVRGSAKHHALPSPFTSPAGLGNPLPVYE